MISLDAEDLRGFSAGTMSQVDPSKLAFQAGKMVLGAAHAFDIAILGSDVRVAILASPPSSWPFLPGKQQLSGLVEDIDGPWPAAIRFSCTWGNGRGSVELEMRLDISRQRGAYEGHLALHVVTLPSNRQIVWINLTARIRDALTAGQTRCVIPANFSLWTRAGERSARPLTDALMKLSEGVGLTSLAPTQLHMFDVALPSGELVPPPAAVFESLVKTALLKLPFVTRGEASDVRGGPLFDIHSVIAASPAPPISAPEREAQSPPATPPINEVEEATKTSQENMFFDYLRCENFGPFRSFEWEKMAKVNLIVGENDTGKSHLLRLMYALAKSVEDATLDRATEGIAWARTLAAKVDSTFEPEDGRLGALVHRSGANPAPLSVEATLCNEDYSFSFGADAGGKPEDFREIAAQIRPQPKLHTLYLPPKEILTSLDAIAMVRARRVRGFDDTYFDLAIALNPPEIRDPLPPEMRSVTDTLAILLNGRIDRDNNQFFFVRGSERFAMSQTAEGIKKIGILDRLIRNQELRRGAILFLDEPEANLHPSASRTLVRILFDLAGAGVQIFVATHSNFVLKEMELFARERTEPVMLCSLTKAESGIEALFYDLQEGVPETGIEKAAFAQYDDDVMLAWNGKR